MGKDSKIQWTTHTFNPWRGCVEVSPGCAHCYAREMAKRNPAVLGVWGESGTRVVASENQWREPLKWDREAKAAGERRRVFCASLADVFEDWRGKMVTSKGEAIFRVDLDRWPGSGGGIAWEANPTLKIGLDRRMLTMDDVRERLLSLIASTPNLDWLLLTKRPENALGMVHHNWPNVWVGTTVENQEQAKKRIPVLLQVPAAVRFLSVEPMIDIINIREYLESGGIGWVICGGESGRKARPFSPLWARRLRDQCADYGVPFFMKQFGSSPAYPEPAMRDSHGADPDEWPEDLRVREFPTAAA